MALYALDWGAAMSEELRRRDESTEPRMPPVPGEVEAELRRGSRRSDA